MIFFFNILEYGSFRSSQIRQKIPGYFIVLRSLFIVFIKTCFYSCLQTLLDNKYFSCKNITINHTLICPSILFYSNVQKFQNVTVLLTLNGNKESKKSDQEIKIPQYFLGCNENVQMMTILALSKIGFLAMHFLFDTYIE